MKREIPLRRLVSLKEKEKENKKKKLKENQMKIKTKKDLIYDYNNKEYKILMQRKIERRKKCII